MVAVQPNRGNSPAGVTFKITDWKLYVPVVTLPAENDNRLLHQLKTGFKRTIKLGYSVDPTFTKVNRLFVLSFGNETDRTSFSKYYVPKVEIRDFNVAIN